MVEYKDKYFRAVEALSIFLQELEGLTPPPKEVPPHLYDEFAMDGQISISNQYLNDQPFRIKDEDGVVSLEKSDPQIIFLKSDIDHYQEMVRKKDSLFRSETDTWLYEALEKYPINGKTIAIMGAALPWDNAVCLEYGAHPVTIEYQARISDDPRLDFYTPSQFERTGMILDCALSLSSFEHDGLGRYGDPIDPNGDLKAMQNMKKTVRKNGLMYLSLPTNTRDEVRWNANRIYGPIRLPMMLEGWHIVDVFGAPEQCISVTDGKIAIDPAGWQDYYEKRNLPKPEEWVFVLRN